VGKINPQKANCEWFSSARCSLLSSVADPDPGSGAFFNGGTHHQCQSDWQSCLGRVAYLTVSNIGYSNKFILIDKFRFRVE
jgi:hypothetical protein